MSQQEELSRHKARLYTILEAVVDELKRLDLQPNKEDDASNKLDIRREESSIPVVEARSVEHLSTHPVGARIVVTRKDKYFQRKGVIIENPGKTFIDVRLDHIPATPYTREYPSVIIKKIPKYLAVQALPKTNGSANA